MSRQDRRNAVIVAVIAAVGAILAALISSGFWKKEPHARTAAEPKMENKAESRGAQSPAVAGGRDVTITYGEKPAGKSKTGQAK
jgi:hypothetical protein